MRIARAGLVRTFQNLRLFCALTVRENVEVSLLVAETHRSDRRLPTVDELIAAAGLWEHRDRRARELDYGNSRRLELARAAGMVPTFLLLDEPTSRHERRGVAGDGRTGTHDGRTSSAQASW